MQKEQGECSEETAETGQVPDEFNLEPKGAVTGRVCVPGTVLVGGAAPAWQG